MKRGSSVVSPWIFRIIRSVIDDSARGKLDFLDGVISYETCLQARHLPFIVQKTGWHGYYQRIFLPGSVVSEAGRQFMIDNLKRLTESLESFTGQEISRERLSQSILIYNENRGLLRQLYQLRKRNPGLLKAKEVLAIVHSSMLMLKEEHNQMLQRLFPDLEKRALKPESRARVILSGSLCEAPRSFILDLIEEAGMVIIDDDLYTGSRYFINDAGTDEDPLEALTNRYLKRNPPSPTKVDSEMDWSDYLFQMVTQNEAVGVISLVVKFCPPHLAYYPDIERKLSRAGVHTMMLEMEHEVTSLEQVKTRLQAFGESLETT
ncbi:MAG: 2-hydroxyacyl-CoA dehydratase [Deltaproteobacteria bacterium]|nr:2-hydroxyacyl-CoA dehydratase [Deltaproteobacteria bacterium]